MNLGFLGLTSNDNQGANFKRGVAFSGTFVLRGSVGGSKAEPGKAVNGDYCQTTSQPGSVIYTVDLLEGTFL